jgi:hypothetical protein
MAQIREVHLKSDGNYIIVIPSGLYVNAGDIVRFIADDNYTYEIVISNRDKFFVSTTGATIELQVTQSSPADTPAISSKPTSTTKYYTVTRVDIDSTCSPPKIIVISTTIS